MALPTVGGGYQIGDGNINEAQLLAVAAPQTATVTATLSAAQILGGILAGSPGTSAASYTLPTVTALETALNNAVKVGSAFDLTVLNVNGTSSGVITILAGAGTGWTISGLATVALSTAVGSAVMFRARKTGDGTWTLYRIAG